MVMLKMGGGWIDYVMQLIANRLDSARLLWIIWISAICQNIWIKTCIWEELFSFFFSPITHSEMSDLVKKKKHSWKKETCKHNDKAFGKKLPTVMQWQHDKTLRKLILKTTNRVRERQREGHQRGCYQCFYGMKVETVTLPVMWLTCPDRDKKKSKRGGWRGGAMRFKVKALVRLYSK